MPILKVKTVTAGLSGVEPKWIYIKTNDTAATVLTEGYLNDAKNFGYTFSNEDMALVSIVDGGVKTTMISEVYITTSGASLKAAINPSNVDLPVNENHIAIFYDNTGKITQGSIDEVAIHLGVIRASQGFMSLSPAENRGSLLLECSNNHLEKSVTISNDSHAQSTSIKIPDSGEASCKFLLDIGPANIISHQEFVGINDILMYTAGPWTPTRNSKGDYSSNKAQADETAIIGIDITPMIRATVSKGFRLDSFDVIYKISTMALDDHSVTLDRIEYSNEASVSVNAVATTGALSTTTNANPRFTNISVDTPSFDNDINSKYVVEVTVDAAATSDYAFYGLMLNFSQTIG